MHDKPDMKPSAGSSQSPEGRLDSWKEIAAYLGRGIRTVQRWEREEGLPVHRLAHEKRGSIYARREELAAWWESRRLTLASPPTESDSDSRPVRPRLERVTFTSAMTSWPALSSDTRLVAYVSDAGQDGARPQIWIQQMRGAALCLTNGEFEYSHLSFSPDDTRIIFTATNESGPSVYEVPTLGGEPRLLQRGAGRGSLSGDGQWLVTVPRDSVGMRISARGGAGFRTVAPQLVDVTCATWSPDSRAVLVNARADATFEPDWWVVPLDGGPPTNTGIVRQFRKTGMFAIPTGAAWIDDTLVVSAAGPPGVCLYPQRITPSTFQPVGAPEQLSAGGESAWLPSGAGRHVAFVSSRADLNLWSVPIDRTSGIANGQVRRLTRGPSPMGYLTATRDFRTLAYSSFRPGHAEIFLRDLQASSETVLGFGPGGQKGYPAISPGGNLLAYGVQMPGGERAERPIFVISLTDGNWRKVGDDCGGRPRQWVDERLLMIERFARLNSIAVIDTETGVQRELLASAEHSITNPRLSTDREWIAFDASHPGEPPSVFVCRFRDQAIPQSAWILVDRLASHPFWSADGDFLYYTPTGTNPFIRSVVLARRFNSASDSVDGESVTVYSSIEIMMPAYLPGTAPIATPDQILLILGDFRGDIWLMDLDPDSNSQD